MAEVQRQNPPTRLYEVRTVHGEAYWAEGSVIESGDGWFTLWDDWSNGLIALRVPEADIRAVRQVPEGELEAETTVEVKVNGTADAAIREIVRAELAREIRRPARGAR